MIAKRCPTHRRQNRLLMDQFWGQRKNPGAHTTSPGSINGVFYSDFHIDPRRLWRTLLVNGYRELPVTSEHTVAVNDLPPLHKDPFDRILVAQARVEDPALLTADRMVAKYGDGVKKV